MKIKKMLFVIGIFMIKIQYTSPPALPSEPCSKITTDLAKNILTDLISYKNLKTVSECTKCINTIENKYKVIMSPYFNFLCQITTNNGLIPTVDEIMHYQLPATTPHYLVEMFKKERWPCKL